MAVSPLVSPSRATADQEVKAAKAKALPILQGTPRSRPPASPQQLEPTSEMAEQLNENEKRKYVKDKKLGEGTYAIVYLGHHRTSPSTLVAIKKIKVQTEFKDGLSMDAIREVKFLQELAHPNIIALHSVFSSKNQNLNLVLEYLPLGDLEQLIKDTSNVAYGLSDIKAWMGMLSRAVWFCHARFVLHRDIKPNNLLIAADGEVKLADFGLARSFADPGAPMSHQVITRWYRPPELFFGARHYGGAVDVWSMGAVFAELILRTPFMAGGTEMDQVYLIGQAVGTPTEENWPGVSKLPDYVSVDKKDVVPLRDRNYFLGLFGTAGGQGVDLLMKMLVLDPRKRVTAKQILHHEWWTSEPKPTKKENLPKKGGGEKKMAEELKRRGGELPEGRTDKVARKLDFSSMKR
ncbi:MAG: TFIIH complex serine/threonine-protein kinase subunit kin28 [Bathelium mastoideum]|nr:MAG: TFIIH complex serine/threonine-protein kinase subunit kin28 [Bathelium mastoideum]KAI9693838.1 MAG: TFIIH complex serine/threonine-protein kinase subunit kin28 [Bathelium mastoideum]